MGLNATPAADRVHIGIFGKRNVGKSSLINALTGQELAIVSDLKGTTTDPVQKAMELPPLGPVLLIDTPGIDDEGPLGEMRVKKAEQVLHKTDIAVLVAEAAAGLTEEDRSLRRLLEEKGIPYLIVYNQSDLLPAPYKAKATEIYVSATEGMGIEELKGRIAALAATEKTERRIVGDLVGPGDVVVLVTPIDAAAPKGRLILPQQQTIRDILAADALAVVVKPHGLEEALKNLGKPPKLVITDSQAFAEVAAATPLQIPLTSFSILFARYKGLLKAAVQGASVLDTLADGDEILISEGCTHHRQCGDIGTVKLPRWIEKHSGKALRFSFSCGGQFPAALAPYRLVLHCGGCMLGDREIQCRRQCALDQKVPITNYGIAIAHLQGILKRSIAMFPDL